MVKELVIAAYDRDISWISKINDDVKKTVYRKGDNKYDNEIVIDKNVGRDVHTFFYHIYKNYDNLSDITFFAQDYPFDHWGNLIEVINGDVNNLSSLASIKIDGYYGFHNNTLGTAWHLTPSKQFGTGHILTCFSNGMPQDKNPNIDVNKFWNLLFEENTPNEYEFMPGGHFAITKETVYIRSRNFYKEICDLLLSNDTAPWMIERLECYIFNQNYKTKIK